MLPDTQPPLIGDRTNPTLAAHHVLAATLALLTTLYYGALMSVPTNDNFMHMALARQLLAGDLPVRDFFDSGTGLMYVLSAAAERIIGYRLLSEAVVVGVAAGVSVWLVFRLVVQLAGSSAAAVLAALLILIAAPRGYSYPKLIVYAVAATLWWRYVRRPTLAAALMLGVWTAIAFYWRPDHGIYVAVGAVLAMLAARRQSRTMVRHTAAAALTAVSLTAPFFIFAFVVNGLPAYIAAGVVQAEAEHLSANGSHRWPDWPLHNLGDVIRLEAAEAYAPEVTFRWSPSSSAAARAALLAQYQLVPLGDDGPNTERIRLSREGVSALRALVDNPLVEDTAGIDRGQGRIPWSNWAPWRRWQFEHWWLRIRVFPALDEHTAAAEAVAAIWFTLPLIVIGGALAMVWRGPWREGAGQWLAFALFCAIVTFGLVRAPHNVRAVDAVVLPAILFGCAAAIGARYALSRRKVTRAVIGACLVVSFFFVFKSVATAGELSSRVGWLAGEWTSAERMRGAWYEVHDRLFSSPPIEFWHRRADQHAAVPGMLQLADYVRACVPAGERTLVLWFAPEIYYYGDRPAAARHFVFVRGWGTLPSEQDAALRRVQQFRPPIILAPESLDGLAGMTLPRVVDFVRRTYDVAGTLDVDGDHYVVLAQRGRSIVRRHGAVGWPCYTKT